MTIPTRSLGGLVLAGLLSLAPATPLAPALHAQEAGALGFTDLMQIRQVDDEAISGDGRWVVFTAAPDRGDPHVVVEAVDGDASYRVELADNPVFSDDGLWVVARRVHSLAARETAEDPGRLRNGMVLLSLADGSTVEVDEVQRFAFAPGGEHLVWQHHEPPADEDATEGDAEDESARGAADEGDDPRGTELVVHTLATGEQARRPWVTAWALSDDGAHLAYAVGAPGSGADGVTDGVVVHTLTSGVDLQIHAEPDVTVAALSWAEHAPELAFWAAPPAEDGQADARGPLQGAIHRWAAGSQAATAWITDEEAPGEWFIPENTRLVWSDDGERLFFTWRPFRPDEVEAMAAGGGSNGTAEGAGTPDSDHASDFDPYDVDAILADRGVDVWHWQDERIMPQQKVIWNREKERAYLAVRHDDGRVVALGDPTLPDVDVPDNGRVTVAESDVPYRREATWTGGASDLYLVDLDGGDRTLVASEVQSNPSLSPGGDYVVWWHEGAYHLRTVESGLERILTTAELGVPFADEDHDYPSPVPGYGVAGWIEDDDAVLIYDKYDIWVFPTDAGAEPWRLTDGRGRAESRIFRLVDVDGPVSEGDDLLLSSYHDLRKNFGFYRATAGRPGVTRLLEADKRFAYRGRADDADAILYTREAYDEFPDLWVAGADFDEPVKVTDVNPGLTERFAWGEAELLEWESLDGTPLQGVVIKPGNYEEGKRYPVLVYYYRFFSQRLHEFNDPSVNHRPSFPVYASDGYVVFLPDVRFDIGQPGFASTKSVVPGVQKLIEVGIADPDRIALHGHSWSGYQTAFMVTQTDIFRTAIAGAPVANMTSAYSGIRLGSGLARQFQYEQTQSRIGAHMWEALDEYIENSPLFYTDRIETPMLILHGDVDDAVPFEQSIEMFLAMRRLDKEAVFLQYRGEPHHPQRYANKLDWAIKMKEWVDHYLKDAPAPAWISEGVPYRGR